MATKTRLQMIDWVLELLGAKAAGQSASAEDGDLAGRYYDSGYACLRAKGLAPFASDSVPEWAQGHVAAICARDAARAFGVVGEALGILERDESRALRELTEQVSSPVQQTPIVPHWL